jgi:DNA-directed RNA polymerase III subunit RPC8
MLIYIQATISDLVQIRPEDFSKFSAVAIEDNINEKYANKVSNRMSLSHDKALTRYFWQVIQKIGLCIGFYDLLKSSDGLIGHGTGLVNVNGALSIRER